MNQYSRLSYAIAAILGGGALGHTLPARAADTPSADQIQEITVTAQRRAENVQDVPIAIQAFTGETLSQLNITNFDEMVRYLPNVSHANSGPGQSELFMRGLSVGSQGTQSGGSINGFPNVAVYLDDQSAQLPGRNLDIYAADMERIEVLEGPQGTLFGAGAEAGAIRYITNKPKLNVTEGSITGGYGLTTGGDPNTDLTAVLNLPLIADKLAVRAVIYSDRRGGYIDNVPATFTRKSTDLGIGYANFPTGCSPASTPCQVPPSAAPINNLANAANNINPLTYQGLRASLLWQINEDWNLLITQSYQNMDADGVFYQMPHSSDGAPLQPLQVTLFNNSFDKDKFENTAWTANGKFGPLNAVYTGAYLTRNVSQTQDYTNYARGVYADYYQCHGAEPANGLQSTCFSPSSVWTDREHNSHQSHEFRLSTPDDWRMRGIVGAFWEQLKIQDQLEWQYKSLPPCTDTVTVGCMTDVGPAPGATVSNPGIRNDKVAFFNDVQRGYRQTAFFASADFDIVPHVLTVTGGTRWYRFVNDERGDATSSFGCYEAGPAPCLAGATNIDALDLHSVYKGFKSRANISWHFLPEALVYVTWSQGFRPGAFNRTVGCWIPDANGVGQYCQPTAYASDNLTNNELGWKTEFFDHRLQWNGALYRENWDNVQINLFDPPTLGNVGFATNGPNYRVQGIETSFIAAIVKGLTLQGSAAWNHSEQTNSPQLTVNNPALAGDPSFGKPITSVNPYGDVGSPSANSPPVQFNLRLRYEFSINDYHSFAQIGATHTGHSFTQAGSNPGLSVGSIVSTTLLRFENPAYSEFDMSLGVAKDKWSANFFIDNLTNVLKSTFTSTTQFIPAEVVTRPRVLGVKMSYHF
jgi:outer membrane receptor protein involved in Fe transport